MLFMSRGTDEYKSALDCNGFPLGCGDLVEATERLNEKLKGEQGVVT